jgi:inner membrane protein
MDNLSHSVTGLAAGELLHRVLPPEDDMAHQQLRRRLLLVTCWLASNFPDFDLLLTPLLPSPLGYLLHHRGHTHTLVYAIPQAMLLWILIWLVWPAARELLKVSSNARRGFGLAATIGLLLHLLMDYLNSYGVHPFYPFDARWLYGDMVFILEPVFWITFGVPMAMMLRPRALKILGLALLLGAPLYFTTKEYLAWPALGVLSVGALVLGYLQSRAGAQGNSALFAAFATGIAFVGLQAYASHQARLAVERALESKDSARQIIDVSLSSFPSNPICWAFVSVERDDAAASYRLVRGIASVAPELLPVDACPLALAELPAQYDATPAIALVAEERGSLHTLHALKNGNCRFEAWLRFARAPALDGKYASDLRFASSPRGNFTTLNIADADNDDCPSWIPRWDFPRADLLNMPDARR